MCAVQIAVRLEGMCICKGCALVSECADMDISYQYSV